MRSLDEDQLAVRIKQGDRSALARGLSVLERGGEAAQRMAENASGGSTDSYVVGITGAPGAGKSTLTDQLVGRLREADHDVAVLAVDPSSPFSGGAILGDSVRMSNHFLDPRVFIRSMATRGALGGLSETVPDAIRLISLGGFEWIVVETVGVGQVEVDIASSADTTVVVTNPGWGDSVQASKAGLLEVADVLVVNKADRPGAADTEADLRSMLTLRPRSPESWIPPVVLTSATAQTGLENLVSAIESHRDWQKSEGRLLARRRRRVENELRALMYREVARLVDEHLSTAALDAAVTSVLAGSVSTSVAARSLVASDTSSDAASDA